jgi:hypothetical protein
MHYARLNLKPVLLLLLHPAAPSMPRSDNWKMLAPMSLSSRHVQRVRPV